MANSVDPDEMPHSAASHLGLLCLLRLVCLNTLGEYSIQTNFVVVFFLQKTNHCCKYSFEAMSAFNS